MSLYFTAWGIGLTTGPVLAGLLWRATSFELLALSLSGLGVLAYVIGLLFLPPLSKAEQETQRSYHV